MTSEFNLPGSSFEEIQKILKGYSHAPEQVSLDSLSKLTGIHSTAISRNSKFLTDLGFISGGMKKSATDLGRKLGRALDHKQDQDAQGYWKEAVQTNEKVSGLVTTVRIKGGMTEKDFSGHVLYVSGQKNTAVNRTGARCVVDVLLAAGLLLEENGKLVVVAPTTVVAPDHAQASEVRPSTPQAHGFEIHAQTIQEEVPPPLPTMGLQAAVNLTPQVAINIQLHLPETENAEVYEKLFRALREHLLNPAA